MAKVAFVGFGVMGFPMARLGGPDDLLAIAAGMPLGVAGTTNLLRIARVPGAPDQ